MQRKTEEPNGFVDRVIRFLELQPGCEVIDRSEDDPETGVTLFIRHGLIHSRVSGISETMTVSRAAVWCFEVLGSNLGDVWNCDRVMDVAPETQERMDA